MSIVVNGRTHARASDYLTAQPRELGPSGDVV